MIDFKEYDQYMERIDNLYREIYELLNSNEMAEYFDAEVNHRGREIRLRPTQEFGNVLYRQYNCTIPRELSDIWVIFDYTDLKDPKIKTTDVEDIYTDINISAEITQEDIDYAINELKTIIDKIKNIVSAAIKARVEKQSYEDGSNPFEYIRKFV